MLGEKDVGSIIRNLIQYDGIEVCNHITEAFKQTNVDKIFYLPIIKPDIEQIFKVWAKAYICKHKLIKTPVAISLEGQKLTGYKLLIMGDIDAKYEYVALDKAQSLHTAYGRIPFYSYIVMPEVFNPKAIVHPTILIEDIHSELINTRCIYINFTIMLNVDIC